MTPACHRPALTPAHGDVFPRGQASRESAPAAFPLLLPFSRLSRGNPALSLHKGCSSPVRNSLSSLSARCSCLAAALRQHPSPRAADSCFSPAGKKGTNTLAAQSCSHAPARLRGWDGTAGSHCGNAVCAPQLSPFPVDALGMGMTSPQLHGHGRFASAWMARNEIPGFPLGFGLLAGCCPGSQPDPLLGGCREQGSRMLLAWGCIFQLQFQAAISLKTLISAVQTRWLKLCDFEGEKKDILSNVLVNR